jgi:Uma2 family endonuclease
MSQAETNLTKLIRSFPNKESLPTMYDLPSEDPEEEGLPNTYHWSQGDLLRKTCQPINYYPDKLFSACDLNLYYDVNHPNWYKRPDWFVAIAVDRLYKKTDPRQSYVIWQEEISPLIVVELLSPGTAKEDLGEKLKNELEIYPDGENKVAKTPNYKWDVYEKILKIPYYFVFSDITNKLRYFRLIQDKYEEQILPENSPVWIPELKLCLGLWYGNYDGFTRLWLRWLDMEGNWILTGEERADKERLNTERERLAKQIALQEKEEEKLAKEQERLAKQIALQEKEEEKLAKELALQEKEQLQWQLKQVAKNLLNSGMNVEQVYAITGLNTKDITF